MVQMWTPRGGEGDRCISLPLVRQALCELRLPDAAAECLALTQPHGCECWVYLLMNETCNPGKHALSLATSSWVT